MGSSPIARSTKTSQRAEIALDIFLFFRYPILLPLLRAGSGWARRAQRLVPLSRAQAGEGLRSEEGLFVFVPPPGLLRAPPRTLSEQVFETRTCPCCCSSVVERVLGKDEVMGPTPISSSI